MASRVHLLRKACQHGDLRTVRDMIRGEGVPVDAPQDDGCTALWLASEEGHADVADYLCRIGADTAATKTQGGVSCLYVAAQNGHSDVVKVLLDAGANANHAKESGATPLFISSQQNNHAIASLLLAAGAVADQPTRAGITPLMIACYQGNVDIVRLLLEAGADPRRVGGGKSPIEWARSNGTQDAIARVLDPYLRRGGHAPQQAHGSPRGRYPPEHQQRPHAAAGGWLPPQHHVHHHAQPPGGARGAGLAPPPVRVAGTPETLRSTAADDTSYETSSVATQSTVMDPPIPPQRKPRGVFPSASPSASSRAGGGTPVRQTLHADPYDHDSGVLSSPEQGPRPSQAYLDANASLAKLFKIKDQPIDLENAVLRHQQHPPAHPQRKRNTSRSPGRAGVGGRKKPAAGGARGGVRAPPSVGTSSLSSAATAPGGDGDVHRPAFIAKEEARARMFKDEMLHEKHQTYTRQPVPARGGGLEPHMQSIQQRIHAQQLGAVPMGSEHPPLQWENHKYKLALIEDELQRTRYDVCDEWMFTPTELARRRDEKRQFEDTYGFSEFIVPSTRTRTTCETSPDRRQNNTIERRKMVLNPSERDLPLDPAKVSALAHAMGVADVEGLQRRVDQLADANCKLRDRHDYDYDGPVADDTFDTAAAIDALREGMPERERAPPPQPPAVEAPPAPPAPPSNPGSVAAPPSNASAAGAPDAASASGAGAEGDAASVAASAADAAPSAVAGDDPPPELESAADVDPAPNA